MKPTSRLIGEKENLEYVHEIRDLLEDSDLTHDVDIRENRRPILLDIYLKTDHIPPEVKDVIEEFDLVIDDVGWGSGPYGEGLNLTTYVIHDYEYFETFKVRTHGNSFVVTLSRDVLDKAGASEGDPAALYARPGSIRIDTGQ